MIERERICILHDTKESAGDYVLYWMQASQRSRHNPALEHAIHRANESGKPLVVAFGLMDNYPEANERHYAFMLQGLAEVEANLAKRNIRFIIRHGPPADVAIELAKHATRVICDRGYLRHQKQWREKLAQNVNCPVEQVESDVVVPVDTASDKPEYAARTLRPKIHKHWKQFIKPLPAHKAKHSGQSLKLSSNIDLSNVEKTLAKLKLDRDVKPMTAFIGGESEAHKRLSHFLSHRLKGYAEGHNEPADDGTSTLSPYLHFGQISPVDIAAKVQDADAPATDRDVYLEELIVRRELSMNFCNFSPKYDEFENLPSWAKKTLAAHHHDKRPETYTRHQLETAQTNDRYWNAAQREMLATGFTHNYMRMYWGKQVLNWKRTPAEAYADILHLNNKYFLDGRDPISFANVAWIFGQHDRPWANRPIFGNVRYMNQAGLLRKFDMDAYVKKVEALENRERS